MRVLLTEEQKLFNKRVYNKKWMSLNRDKVNASAKRYRDGNKEKVNASVKKWREQNREAWMKILVRNNKKYKKSKKGKISAAKYKAKPKVKERGNVWMKKLTENLGDLYVRRVLKLSGFPKEASENKELIEIQRLILKTKRELKIAI